MITSLDVTQNTALQSLACNNNSISSLDLSQHAALIYLDCSSNSLTNLNVANGNNANITNGYFLATGNPNLTCIEVDDVVYSTTSWTNIDAGASFSLDCSGSSAAVNEINALDFSLFPNPASSNLRISSEATINEITILDATGKIVKTTTQSSFSVAELTNGIYFLTISTDKGTAQKKFIKE